MSVPVTIDGDLAVLEFSRFDLDSYAMFIKAKRLPESQVSYTWQTDTYTLTTPARFAAQLGIVEAPVSRARLPYSAHLRDYQRWTLDLALDAKRFAVWADTGLGKTNIYLEFARQVRAMTGGRVLILAPLMVIPQVQDEAADYFPELTITHLHTREELAHWCEHGEGIAAVNYEKFIAGQVKELRLVAGLVADESSILRTGGGVIKWNLIKSARGIEYKLSCTATPAPNEAMEYASQAAFLEKLRSEGDILWTYFQRDKHGVWSVKPHAKEAFYKFMASWSLYLRNPATFGFEDILADLPDPEIIEEPIRMTTEQGRILGETLTVNHAGLWADDRLSATVRGKILQVARGFRYVGTGKERRAERIPSWKPGRVAELAAGQVHQGRPTLIWTTFDEESTIISERIPDVPHAVLSGATPLEERVEILRRFRAGEIMVLISKPQLLGYGLNLQFVQSMIFSGFDDSFERLYQAVRRAYRFGQTETVRVFMPYIPELEGMVFKNLKRKESRFLEEVAAQERHYRAAMSEQLAAREEVAA